MSHSLIGMLTLTGVGGPPGSGSYQHWLHIHCLSLAKLELKVVLVGRGFSLVDHISKLGHALVSE